MITYCLCPIHCHEWGVTAEQLCLEALSGCGAQGSVLMTLLAMVIAEGLPSLISPRPPYSLLGFLLQALWKMLHAPIAFRHEHVRW